MDKGREIGKGQEEMARSLEDVQKSVWEGIRREKSVHLQKLNAIKEN